jgi:hypothetical protein
LAGSPAKLVGAKRFSRASTLIAGSVPRGRGSVLPAVFQPGCAKIPRRFSTRACLTFDSILIVLPLVGPLWLKCASCNVYERNVKNPPPAFDFCRMRDPAILKGSKQLWPNSRGIAFHRTFSNSARTSKHH